MNNAPTQSHPLELEKVKTPFKSPNKFTPRKAANRAVTKKPSPSNNKKFTHLRNIKDILTRQKLELEKNSFIDKANIFQSWMDDLAKKITQQSTPVKEKYSLFPLPKAKADSATENLIAQIKQLQAEISFLSSAQEPEEINETYDFLNLVRNQLQELCVSADEKNNELVALKKEEQRLLQENGDRIMEACKKQSNKNVDLVPSDQISRRPMLLFNASDLQNGLKRGNKKPETVKTATPEKRLNQRVLIEAKGVKQSLLNQYNGHKGLGIPVDIQLKSEIDRLLNGKNIDIALEDQEISHRIFDIFKRYQEDKPKKIVTPHKAATIAVDLNTKLAESFSSLKELNLDIDPVPKEEIFAKIMIHLREQIKFIKEDAVLKQDKIRAVLSKLDREIEAEQKMLLGIKETLSKERIAIATAEELPARSAELKAELDAVKTDLAAQFKAQLLTVQTQFNAQLLAVQAQFNASSAPLLTSSAQNSFTPAFSASQSPLADTLSTETISFLKLNEFSCTNRSDLDKCKTSKKFLRYTPLTLAAIQINEVACKSLINDGASVNGTNELGNTPLHMIGFFKPTKASPSIEDAERLTEFFIAKGGDPSIRNKEGKAPGDTAINQRIAMKLKL